MVRVILEYFIIEYIVLVAYSQCKSLLNCQWYLCNYSLRPGLNWLKGSKLLTKTVMA